MLLGVLLALCVKFKKKLYPISFFNKSVAILVFLKNIVLLGILSRFLSSKYFLITTRLAYSAYLVQFPMFFYIIGSTKSSDYFSVIRKNVRFLRNWLKTFLLFPLYLDGQYFGRKKGYLSP